MPKKLTKDGSIIYHVCEHRCYRLADAERHPHHQPGTCALGWRKATRQEMEHFEQFIESASSRRASVNSVPPAEVGATPPPVQYCTADLDTEIAATRRRIQELEARRRAL